MITVQRFWVFRAPDRKTTGQAWSLPDVLRRIATVPSGTQLQGVTAIFENGKIIDARPDEFVYDL